MKQRIDIEPYGKGRPRFGNGHAYTPQKTAVYEREIRRAYIGDLYTEPIRVGIVFGMRVPKSASKLARTEMLLGTWKPAKKPDIDNLAKAVLDALNGTAYVDDKQIVKLTLEKVYAERPYVEIEIEEA